MAENAALMDRIQHLETEGRSQGTSAQTVYKVKPSGQTRGSQEPLKHGFFIPRAFKTRSVWPSDGPALSLDISQPAANPAALAMAILSSSDSMGRTGSNHQVPLVIISQPLPGPITGQNSGPAPPATADQADPDGAVDSTVDLVLELQNVSMETEESLSSTNVTSLPAADGPSASGATPTSGEDAALHVSFLLRPESLLFLTLA